jgi:membrane carboxypeptidase/penicillin-binding protein PbpC
LGEAVAKWTGRPKGQVAGELAGFAAALSAFDKIEVRTDATTGGRLRIAVNVELVKPLR